MPGTSSQSQRGALMIEVLLTIVIIIIGLLGLMQMQGRLQKSEVESYQRSQALLLAKDMASRISTNRANASDYTIGDPNDPTSIGGTTCPTAVSTLQERDEREWCLALQGASESLSGEDVGGLINGRGCVYSLSGGREYQISVVWQGLTPIPVDPNNPGYNKVICGMESPNPYDNGAQCTDDACRRTLTTVVRLGTLPP